MTGTNLEGANLQRAELPQASLEAANLKKANLQNAVLERANLEGAHLEEADLEGAPDGLKLDKAGNLYCTGQGGVWIFAPEGKHLGTIQPREVPANVAWGDDGQTLYMTARTGLYRIRLTAEGM